MTTKKIEITYRIHYQLGGRESQTWTKLVNARKALRRTYKRLKASGDLQSAFIVRSEWVDGRIIREGVCE